MDYVYKDPLYRANDESASTRGKYNTPIPQPDARLVAREVSAPAAPTPSRDFGPFFVRHAPFRGSLLPAGETGEAPGEGPAAPGQRLLVRGVVKSSQGAHLPYATLDVWQASPAAIYDYRERDGQFRPYLSYIGELNEHSEAEAFHYRARVLTDERGRFEYQTLVPPPYLDPEDNTWRCPHVHHFVQAAGHASCVTQIMFRDMPKNDIDNHIRPELTYALARAPGTWTADVAFVLLELAN